MAAERTQRGPIAAAALCALACASACAPEGQRDVLLVTVDTLRPDHLGIYGYARETSPHLDRWLEDAAIFERAYSTEANTPPSVVSLLSGLPPHRHRVRLFYQLVPESTRLLPEMLPEAYVSAAFVSNVVLSDDALGIGARFDHYDDRVDQLATRGLLGEPVWERSAADTTDAVLRWLAEAADPERPLFLWVHYIDPHSPYEAPDAAPRRFEHDEPMLVPRERVRRHPDEGEEVDALDVVDDYDEEIAYLDAEIGELLDGFATLRDVDRSLLVFTADHGESMTEHEIWFTHGYQVYEEIIRVPLVVRGPGVEPGRFRVPVSGIDVAPTILAFVGAQTPESWEGLDLRRAEALPPERTVLAEAASVSSLFGYWRTAIRGDEKWVTGLERGGREIVHRRFYDLARDPGELEPGEWRGEDAAARRLVELAETDPDPGGLPEEVAHGRRPKRDRIAPRANAEQRRMLRALGYAESEEEEEPTPEAPR